MVRVTFMFSESLGKRTNLTTQLIKLKSVSEFIIHVYCVYDHVL